ncbi:SDR family NAD(P)-dependent oxidoreductase [soil metagenome]
MLARSDAYGTDLASSLTEARAYACDVGDAAAVDKTFAAIRTELGEPAVVIYNAGSGMFGGFAEVTAADFEASWRVNTLGSFLVAKQVIPAMEQAHHGAFIFIRATASRRGGAKATAFAPAKAAQRSFAESLARQCGPKGVHIAIVIIDGVVDLARTRARMPDKPDDFFVKPDEVAGMVAMLVAQPRSTWTFELEARPFGETW